MATQPNQGSNGSTHTSDPGGESRARDLALQAREKAGAVADQYVERARSGVEDTMSRAASELGTVANALRQCGSDMAERENAMILPYVEQVADQVDRLSSFLENRRVDDLARDVEGFARRNPAVFLGACFGVGILAARFLKSRGDEMNRIGYNADSGFTPSYQTFDNRSVASAGAYDANSAASYTEPDRGTSYSGGGAAYSGELRGVQGSTDRTVGGNPDRNR